jgi:hypothetical protein
MLKTYTILHWSPYCLFLCVLVLLFQIQADSDTGWETDSQTIGYRMCHICDISVHYYYYYYYYYY